jgi:hypothetical protein
MISRTTFCSAQASAMRSDPSHLPQTIRLDFDRVEHSLAECPNELARVNRADAADHAGAEIFLDALDRRRGGGLEKPRPELLAMGTIIDPFA